MEKDFSICRQEVCAFARKMAAAGWVTGSSGNVSVRAPGEDCYAITPTSVDYDELAPENIVICDGEGETMIEVENAPSFELPVHVAVYRARPEVNAIIHTHAPFSTILSVLRLGLPPIIEEMVPYLGGEIEVAEYGQSGSDQLAESVVRALGPKAAVLIANHGNLLAAKSLKKAFNAASLLERAAMIYLETLKLQALNRGIVHQLPDQVIELEKEMFETIKTL